MIKFIIAVTTLASFSTLASGSGIWPSPNFGQAKNILKTIYKSSPNTFYCGCDIEWVGKKKLIPNKESCGYQARKTLTRTGKINERAKRIEWEHIVPAWEFGHQLQCWQTGGRKACKKVPKFKAMEGDLHNLVPTIGEVNGDRSNYKFAIVTGEKRVYGQCDAEVDFKAKAFEPKPEVRGDIARTYFYFEKKYGLKISRKQKQLFTAWSKEDPVSKYECQIHEQKAKRQGWQNQFVQPHCE